MFKIPPKLPSALNWNASITYPFNPLSPAKSTLSASKVTSSWNAATFSGSTVMRIERWPDVVVVTVWLLVDACRAVRMIAAEAVIEPQHNTVAAIAQTQFVLNIFPLQIRIRPRAQMRAHAAV